jgi:hypothetical protein
LISTGSDSESSLLIGYFPRGSQQTALEIIIEVIVIAPKWWF